MSGTTFDWPRLIGTVFAHREARLLAALRALDPALAKPKVAPARAAAGDAGGHR